MSSSLLIVVIIGRYRDARKWIVECPHCGVKAPFDGVVRRASENTNNDNDSYPSWECGLICPNRGCAKVYSTAWLCNMLTIAIRNHIQEYYKVNYMSLPTSIIKIDYLLTCGNLCLDTKINFYYLCGERHFCFIPNVFYNIRVMFAAMILPAVIEHVSSQ